MIKSIWTDNENSRALLWDAYNGYLEHYNNYMMYRSVGKHNPMIVAGLIRYAHYFYEEAFVFFDSFNLKDCDKAKQLFTKQQLVHEDFVFLRHFFNEFMFVSGIKDIIMSKDGRTGAEKVADRYKVEL
jgi:hypothetical protein